MSATNAREYRAIVPIEGYVHKFRLEAREESAANAAASEPTTSTVSLGSLLAKLGLVAIVLLAMAASLSVAQAAEPGDTSKTAILTRAQFDACPFRPQFAPECLESVEGRPKLLACQARSSSSAEELAEGELGARTFEGARRLGVHVERGLE